MVTVVRTKEDKKEGCVRKYLNKVLSNNNCSLKHVVAVTSSTVVLW